jgi:putative ABC transport system permease protein
MGVQLRSGRGLTPNDTAGAPPVVVVNEAFARRFLPNEDPLGRHVRFSPPGFTPPTASAIEWEIVGVVESVGVGPPDRLSPEVYVHYEQHPTRRGYVSLRAAGDPLQLVEPARATIRAMDAQVLFGEPRTLEQIRSQSFAIPRILTSLVAGFGGLALLLSGMGLYGLMAWLVTQRTQELGVRSALGASRRDLLVLVLRQACARTWVGIAVGIVGAFATTRLLRSLLFGTAAGDPYPILVAAAVLVSVALVATWAPARRASRIDPVVALREE